MGGEVFSIHPNYNVSYNYEMVQDNDDNDRWSDRGTYATHWHYHSGDPFADPDGVFPGKDEDHDGIPDTNRDGDGIPDYEEPFLMYDVEPDDYVWGPDLNNNGIPDEREDDLDPDLPYDRDLRGYHVFARMGLTRGMYVTLGKLDSEGIASGGSNKAEYGGVSVQMSAPDWGDVFFNTALKRVHDDIEDPYRTSREVLGEVRLVELGWVSSTNRGYEYFDAADHRFYRNSLVSRSYLRGVLKRRGGLQMGSSTRLDINWQREGMLNDGTYQPEDRVSRLALVDKVDYIWQPLRRWRLIGQAKLLLLREQRQSLRVPLRDEWTFMPIFNAVYQVSPRTELWFGMHGFPGFAHRFKDRAKPRESYREETLALYLINRSRYYGYGLVTSFGVSREQREYDDVLRVEENWDVTSAFLRVYLGFE